MRPSGAGLVNVHFVICILVLDIYCQQFGGNISVGCMYWYWIYLLRHIGKYKKKCGIRHEGWGGKGVRAEKKTQTNFKKCFFLLQKPNKIIKGPPKHVFHLVWSVYVFSTAIGTALKIAEWSQITGIRRPVLQGAFL